MYMIVKHLHATFAVLSLVFLLLRVFLAWSTAAKLDKPWLKVLPHAIDGLLVASIVGVVVVTGMYPFSVPFVTEKLIAFIVYIVFSVLTVLALRGRFSVKLKAPFAAVAIMSWFWLAKVAFMKQGVLLAAMS